jgi:hypothetical protein
MDSTSQSVGQERWPLVTQAVGNLAISHLISWAGCQKYSYESSQYFRKSAVY